MDNKKKVIIAIVLFIFLGLMVFTFANPGDEESNKLDGNGTEEKENSTDGENNTSNEDNENTITGDNNTNNAVNNQNNNVANNNLAAMADNSYNLALEAVINAEAKIDEESYESAKDLVEKVTNNEQKEALQERLDEVKDGIDAKALVEELTNKVETSENKENMDDARDFREDEEVVSKVNELTNETLKEELLAQLTTLALLLDDTTAPAVNIKDGAVLASETEILIEDDNEVVITIQEEGNEDSTEIPNGYMAKEGTYVLTVTDEAFNETVVTFTIDLSAPEFNVTSGTHSTEDINVVITDRTFKYVEIYNQDANTIVLSTDSEFTLEDEATYRLTAYDEAGNSTVRWLAIDKTNPTITGVEKNKDYKEDVTVTIEDKFLTKVLVNGEEQEGIVVTGTNNEGKTLVKTFTEEGTYIIEATDKVGNTTTVRFTIDKTSAVRKSADFYVSGLTQVDKVFYTQYGKTLVVNITTNEELANIPTFTLHNNGNDYVIEGAIYRGLNDKGYHLYQASYEITKETGMTDGEITFTVSNIVDKAGNLTSDVVEATNGRRVMLDNTPASRVYSTLRVNNTEYEEEGTKYYYVKNGDEFEFAISFNELLKDIPTVTIGGKEVEMSLNQKVLNNEGKFLYEGTVKIAEDESELVEGLLDIKVSNVVDLAGNVSSDETVLNQTKTSNGRSVIYDRTYATISFTSIATTNDNVYDNVYYVKNGDTITFRMGTKEILAENPVVKIGGKTVEMKYVKYFEQPNHHEYSGTLTIAKDEQELLEGTLEFTVSNIIDRAGNEGFIYQKGIVHNDITTKVTTNGKSLIYDRTLPNAQNLAIIGGRGYWIDKEYVQYAKEGTIVYVNARFYEELSETPIVTLNNKVTMTLGTKKYDESSQLWIYSYSYKLTKNDGLEDGTIQVKVTNIKDKAGNTIEPLTNSDMKLESQSEVVIDRTAPVSDKLTIRGGNLLKEEGIYTYYANESDIIYVNSYFKEELQVAPKFRINGSIDVATTTIKYDEKTKTWNYASSYKLNVSDGLQDGLIQLEAYGYEDKAGNTGTLTNADMKLPSQSRVVIDRTAPVILLAGTEGLNKNEYRVESGTKVTTEDVTAKVIDDNADSTAKIEKADLLISNIASENIYNYDFTNGFNTRYVGRYNIKYTITDKAGNTTTAVMLLVMNDTTAPTIVLKGTEGRNNNELRVAQDDVVTLSDVEAIATDNVDSDKVLQPVSIRRYYPKETGKASHVYDATNGFDTTTPGYYTIEYTVTDSSNNTATKTMLLVVQNTKSPAVENGVANLYGNLTLIDEPFYNVVDSDEPVTINGNGYTVTQKVTSEDKFQWIGGIRTTMGNMFASKDGEKITVNNLTFAGTTQTIMLGQYRSSTYNNYNSELTNVNAIGLEVVSFSANISPAVTIYGTAALNNTNIYGTKLSNLDTSPRWPVYDLALVNYSTTTINGGKIGSIVTWNQMSLILNNAEVDTILTAAVNKEGIVVNSGTVVNLIEALKESDSDDFRKAAKAPKITINSGATVKTLDLRGVTDNSKITIDDNATVNTIITDSGEMTLTEWKEANK